MQIRRLPDPKLKPDHSNLHELPLNDLKRHLLGPEGPLILRQVKIRVFEQARSGGGTSIEQVPDPHVQQGLECQTMALINGVISVGGSHLFDGRNITQFVRDVRRRAEVNNWNRLSMADVALFFPELGIPLIRLISSLNPIALTGNLFRPNRFLGALNSASFHVTTIVPVQDATEFRFVVKLDSLGGAKRILGIDEYMEMLLRVDPHADNYYVYTLNL